MSERMHTTEQSLNEPLSRRVALARLGLTAAAVYAVPTVTRLDREALAQGLPSPVCPPGRPGCFNADKG